MVTAVLPKILLVSQRGHPGSWKWHITILPSFPLSRDLSKSVTFMRKEHDDWGIKQKIQRFIYYVGSRWNHFFSSNEPADIDSVKKEDLSIVSHTQAPGPQPDEESYLSVLGSKHVPSSCWESYRLAKITGPTSQELWIWAVSELWGTRPTAGWRWQVLDQLELSAFKFCMLCTHT